MTPDHLQRISDREYEARYSKLSYIGQGGYGTVFKALDNHLGRAIALKEIPLSQRSGIDEAAIAAGLEHKNIVSINNQFVVDRSLYDDRSLDVLAIDMRYYPETLSNRISELDQQELRSEQRVDIALRLTRPLLDALQYVHQEGYLHRDLKPANILLQDDGTPILADFGIARKLEGRRSLTAGMGTAYYMAPEQIESHGSPDHRTDLYQMGVTLHELAGGSVTTDILESFVNTPIGEGIDALIAKATQKDAENRFSSAGEMGDEIQRLLNIPASQMTPDFTVPVRHVRDHRTKIVYVEVDLKRNLSMSKKDSQVGEIFIDKEAFTLNGDKPNTFSLNFYWDEGKISRRMSNTSGRIGDLYAYKKQTSGYVVYEMADFQAKSVPLRTIYLKLGTQLAETLNSAGNWPSVWLEDARVLN